MIRRALLFAALVTAMVMLASGVALAVSCEINDGDQFTNDRRVTVSFDTSGHAEYRISSDYDLTGAAWQTARSQYNDIDWTLDSGMASGDGEKTVYMQFRDGPNDNYLPHRCDDDIILDTKPPTTSLNGAPSYWVNHARVTLSATDASSLFSSGSGVERTEYAFNSSGPWQHYSYGIEISDEDQAHIFYRSVDKAGNVEVAKDEDLKIDTVGPVCKAKSLTVRRGQWYVGLPYYVSDDHSSRVNAVISIKDYSGTTKKRFHEEAMTGYWWKYLWNRCTLPRGTYSIVVTGKDEAGNQQAIVGYATLRVR